MDLPRFRHFLNFKNDNTGLIEISEMEGFDAASFTIDQEPENLGLDRRYMSMDLNLTFNEGFYEPLETEQMMPNGEITYHLTQGLPFILDYKKRFGFESVVEYILQKDGVTFVTGVLDFPNAKTDGFSKFSCGIIDNDLKAKLKRNWEVNVDLFSDKDLDGNAIAPIGTTNILLKAKPTKQVSGWTQNEPHRARAGYERYFNYGNTVLKYGVEDTLTPFYSYLDSIGVSFADAINNFNFIFAKNDLTKTVLNIKMSAVFKYRYVIATGSDPSEYAKLSLVGVVAPDPFTGDITDTFEIYSHTISGYSAADFTLPAEITYELPDIPAGYKFYFMWQWEHYESNHIEGGTKVEFSSIDYEITATSTAIDSVVKGIRWGQLIEETIKRTNSLPTDLPRWELGGEFYDQFVFNGKLIRQFIDKPFYSNVKMAMDTLKEVNGSYKINKDIVFVGLETDFYPNIELAAFSQAPDMEYSEEFNVKTQINRLEYNYKIFESDRDEKNTLDSMHTQSQFKLPNTQVENNKKIDVEQIRDANSLESARRQGIDTKDTTSLDNDDKLFMLDVVPLPEGTIGHVTRKLMMRILSNGNLQILNNDLEGTGVPFNWQLIGFSVGDNIVISEGKNLGTWKVLTINPTVIEVTEVSVVSTPFSGEAFIKLSFEYKDILYVNRTNEGFTEINNILNGDNYANLVFTPKSNIKKYYSSYLATCCEKHPDGTINNTFFKNNGEAETNFNGEGLIKENAPINVADLADRHITTEQLTTRVFCSFAQALEILESEQQGFIRVMNNAGAVVKIYPTKLDYEWASETMELNGSVKAEPDIVTIVSEDEQIIINDVGYDAQVVSEGNLQTSNDYIQLFDNNSIALINVTHYSKVSVNGIIYDNIIDLVQSIENL